MKGTLKKSILLTKHQDIIGGGAWWSFSEAGGHSASTLPEMEEQLLLAEWRVKNTNSQTPTGLGDKMME